MGRRNWQTYTDTLNRGINQQPELAVRGEVADARNVWAPNGRLESRPGRVSVGPFTQYESYELTASITSAYVTELNGVFTTRGAGVYFAALNNATNDRIYVGLEDNPVDGHGYDVQRPTRRQQYSSIIIYMNPGGENTKNTGFYAEYWNGTKWRPLNCVCGNGVPFLAQNTTNVFTFDAPWDMAPGDVGAVSGYYWIRFTVTDVGTSAMTFNGGIECYGGEEEYAYVNLFHHVQCAVGTYCLQGQLAPSGVGGSRYAINVAPSPGVAGSQNLDYSNLEDDFIETRFLPQIFSVAAIEDENVVIVADRGKVYEAVIEHDIRNFEVARVEMDESIIGNTATYSRSYIAQRTGFPEADIVKYFAKRIWCAYKNTLWWSEPYPYHRVFPRFNWVNVGDDDNSEITGLATHGEQLVVFKRDSIYIATSAGTTPFGTGKFSIVRVATGTGCIARESIVSVLGRLAFLSDDGIYTFSDSAGLTKVTVSENGSDRLETFVASINKGTAHKSCAINWKKHNVMLLSVPIADAPVPDHIIVWDYKRNSWWIWDEVEAVAMLSGEDFNEPDVFYSVDRLGMISKFGMGYTDNYGTISSYVLSHRIGISDDLMYRLRDVSVTSSNKTQSVTVEVYRNDDRISTKSGVIDLSDSTETSWDDTITDTVTVWNQEQRRSAGISFIVDGDFFQVKLSHSENAQPLRLTKMDVSLLPMKARR